MQQSTYRLPKEAFFLFAGSLLVFTLGLRAEEIIGFDSRFYLFALEMWHRGLSLFPTTYYLPYPDYPVTSTILIYFFAHLFGGLNKLVAILPTAFAASMTLTLTYLIGALHDKRLGWYAVLFSILTLTFLKSARSIALDFYPALFCTACFYLLYSAELAGKAPRLGLIYILLLLSFAFRGPIGFVMPAGIVCTYYVLNQQYKKMILVGSIACVLLVLATMLLASLAYYAQGKHFMQQVLGMQLFSRIHSSYLPFYFYWLDGLANYAFSFPLAILVLLGLMFYLIFPPKQATSFNFLMKCAAWMLVVVLGMSIPGTKKTRYILPMVPAAALMAAYCLTAPPYLRYFNFLRQGIFAFFLCLPLVCILVLKWIAAHTSFDTADAFASFNTLLWCFCLLQVMNIFAVYYYKAQGMPWVLSIAAFAFICTQFFMLEPLELYLDRAQNFVRHIESERNKQGARLVFYKERRDGLPIKYRIHMPKLEQPIFINNPADLNTFSERAFFVTSAEYFKELPSAFLAPFQIVGQEKLGHVQVVVFKKKQA
jgi:4-amino-4-deoxy-L-arabinose transferase-like glycosyltransferase